MQDLEAVLAPERDFLHTLQTLHHSPKSSSMHAQGVDVGASLIEVTPHLINVGPYGSELSIDLPGAISVDGNGIEVSPAAIFY